MEKERVTVWGPDGGDLFEQMSRPVQSRVADLLRPVHAELQELRAIASGTTEASSPTASMFPASPGRPGLDSQIASADISSPRRREGNFHSQSAARSPSVVSIGDPAPPPAGLLASHDCCFAEAETKSCDESTVQSPLTAWAQELRGPLKNPMLSLAAWVEQPSGPSPRARQSLRKSVPDSGPATPKPPYRDIFDDSREPIDSQVAERTSGEEISRLGKEGSVLCDQPSFSPRREEQRGRRGPAVNVSAASAPANDVVLLIRRAESTSSTSTITGGRGGGGNQRRRPTPLLSSHHSIFQAGGQSDFEARAGSADTPRGDVGRADPRRMPTALSATRPAAVNSKWAIASKSATLVSPDTTAMKEKGGKDLQNSKAAGPDSKTAPGSHDARRTGEKHADMDVN